MQDMDVSGSIPEAIRDRIPTESSDARKHIEFTRFVLEKIGEAKPEQPVKKRRARRMPEEGQVEKLDASLLLTLVNKACRLNKSKMFQGQPFASSLATEDYQDLKSAEPILRDQLKILTSIAHAEEEQARATRIPDSSQKRKTPTPALKAIEKDTEKKVQGPKPQKVQKMESPSPAEKEVRDLEKAMQEMDHTLRSLEPFTVEGLMDKERKAGANEENQKKLVGIFLSEANMTLASFCAAYFHATALANQIDPSQGEALRKVLSEVDKRFGKLPVVEAYMKGLAKYVEEKKQKKETSPPTRAPQAEGINTMKEIEPGISKDTQALIQANREAQDKAIAAQREMQAAARSDMASVRDIQYVGLYTTLASGVLAATSASWVAKVAVLALPHIFAPWTRAAIRKTLAAGSSYGKRIITPLAQRAGVAIRRLSNRVIVVSKEALEVGDVHRIRSDPQGDALLLESAKLYVEETKKDSSSMEPPRVKKEKIN